VARNSAVIPFDLGRATFQGLAIVRGLFVFGSTTPIAPSWEFCVSRFNSAGHGLSYS